MTERLWSKDEVAWGLECFRSGDSAEDIAEMAVCSRAEVIANIGPGRLTDAQRAIVSLYTAGVPVREISRELGHTGRPGSYVASQLNDLRASGYPVPRRNHLRGAE